jgi:quercetin dioxygenase-like cupin family protein
MALKHAEPGEVVHLLPKGNRLSTSKTSAIVKSDRFEAVRLVIPGGASIPSHDVDGFITLLCLEGHAVLQTDEEIGLRPGDWVYLGRGVTHSLRGIEDSALLLTILFDHTRK